MTKIILLELLITLSYSGFSQNSIAPKNFVITSNQQGVTESMSPEILWSLGRVSGLGISKDGKSVVYTVSTPNITENKSTRETFIVPVTGGSAVKTFNKDSVMTDKNISHNGIYIIYDKQVKVKYITGKN